jgi:hypothetical protein
VDNRILSLSIVDRRPDPAEAELSVHVVTPFQTPTTEVRGRLVGPRCLYSTTVEIAYPLRPFHPPAGLDRRVVIPEPSFWDPESPFLYEGPIELWQDGRRCDRVGVRHGIRRILLGPHGLRWNGTPLTLRGYEVASATADEMHAWRREGANMLMLPLTEEAEPVWDLADRIGMIVLGKVTSADDLVWRRLQSLDAHASSMGWLLDPALLCRFERKLPFNQPDRTMWGVRLDEPPQEPLPPGVRFVACPGEKAERLAGLGIPLLLLGEASSTLGTVVGSVLPARRVSDGSV